MNPHPPLLGDLLRIAADPAASLDECRALLDAHPLPAGEILRVGNSELCGLPGRIHRLDRVVHVLGLRTIAEIATWVWVEHSTRGGLERWEHALEVGTCALLLRTRPELVVRQVDVVDLQHAHRFHGGFLSRLTVASV